MIDNYADNCPYCQRSEIYAPFPSVNDLLENNFAFKQKRRSLEAVEAVNLIKESKLKTRFYILVRPGQLETFTNEVIKTMFAEIKNEEEIVLDNRENKDLAVFLTDVRLIGKKKW